MVCAVLKNEPTLCCRISDFFSSATKTLPRWLADAGIRRWNTSAAGLDLLRRPACRLGHPLQPSGVDLKSLTKRANLTALLQIPRCHCKTCRSPLLADDTHAECVSCLEKSHSHSESFSLASLLSRIVLFSEFYFPLTCEEKTARQRIRAAGDMRAHVSSMPACLAITTERAFACPLHPTRSTSLCGCERHDLVRCEWQQIGQQPFSSSFRRGRVIGLCDWPCPLTVVCGVSISKNCEAAGWASPSTFVRFYNLDVPALQARVLSD